MEKTLVVSAWLPEQRVALSLLTGRDLKSASFAVPFPVTEAELTKHESIATKPCLQVDFITTGIGSARAAMVVTEALVKNRYRYVIFCGTAGYYPNHPFENKQVVRCTQTLFSDIGVALGASYLPQGQTLTSPLQQTLGDETMCVTTPSITSSTNEARLLGAMGHIENLEFYGVALAAQQFGASWFGLFGLSNEVGTQSHEQWKTLHLEASLQAQTKLLEWYQKTYGESHES